MAWGPLRPFQQVAWRREQRTPSPELCVLRGEAEQGVGPPHGAAEGVEAVLGRPGSHTAGGCSGQTWGRESQAGCRGRRPGSSAGGWQVRPGLLHSPVTPLCGSRISPQQLSLHGCWGSPEVGLEV